MTIFEAIREDHDIQRELCAKLLRTEGETDLRKQLFKALKHELEIIQYLQTGFFGLQTEFAKSIKA